MTSRTKAARPAVSPASGRGSGSPPGTVAIGPALANSARQSRTAGRQRCIQLLYAWEQNRFVDDGHLLTSPDGETTALDDEAAALAFARELFALVGKDRTAIDAAIDERLDNWTIHRLAVTDRAILRLGAAELLYCPDTPPRVAINEAIELAKQFGSDARTAKLINGVLDRLARDHRPGEVKPAKPAKPAKPDAGEAGDPEPEPVPAP